MKKYALEYTGYQFDYYFNLGDDIQTLAATRLLGEVEGYISREKLNTWGSGGVVSLNGFFMGSNNWPPHESIIPVFYSFHIDKKYEQVICSPEGVNYLKKHAPIGCRDRGTVEVLKRYGVDAYYSGCLTLTFPQRSVDVSNPPQDVFIVGVDKAVEKIIPKDIKRQAIRVNQSSMRLPYIGADIKRELASQLLDSYKKHAKLVITSKIHCAMPCLALGIPVVFLYPKDKSDDYRIHLIQDLIPVNYVCKKSISRRLGMQKLRSSKVNWNPTPVNFESRKEEIKEGFLKAIAAAKAKCS